MHLPPIDTGRMPATKLFQLYSGKGRSVNERELQDPVQEVGHYLAGDRLVTAVQTAIAVERPLLVTGEPGCGKTTLAWSIAAELELGEVLTFHMRGESQARDLLYDFDHILRFYDAQSNNPLARDSKNYRSLRALGAAIASSTRRVVLIDEIDKAPRDVPNDLLHEIDRMEFRIAETKEEFKWTFRPIVVITSNSERQLPDAFLRRCVFSDIEFPDRAQLVKILKERLTGPGNPKLFEPACDAFLTLREQKGLKKLPATSELLTWTQRLSLDPGMNSQRLYGELRKIPYVEVLLKFREDLKTLSTIHLQVQPRG